MGSKERRFPYTILGEGRGEACCQTEEELAPQKKFQFSQLMAHLVGQTDCPDNDAKSRNLVRDCLLTCTSYLCLNLALRSVPLRQTLPLP